MKNELPNKIWLDSRSVFFNKPNKSGLTEYTSTDVFIEKTIKFFAPHIQDNSGGYDRANVIENFRNYIKEE